MNESPWQELLERVRAHVPELLHDFLAELESHEGYSDGPVPREDLERTALQAFDLFLNRLASREGEEVSAEFPEALGRRRARQGVRIDQFTEAVRINFRLLWRALDRAAQTDLVDELVANGERVLNVVERYATEVQHAFLDETQRMEQFQRTARERALARLFSGHAEAEELARIAELLGLRPNDTFEMFAVDSSSIAEQRHSGVSRFGALIYEDGELAYLFRSRRGPVDWPVSAPELDGVYISRISGIERLVSAAALAKRLSTVRSHSGSFTLKDGFQHLAGDIVLDRIAGFEHELVGDFANVTPEERSRFAQTIRAFMRSGSIQTTADELYLHRNTVFKRMRAFHELTGLDLSVPRDAAIAILVLHSEDVGVDMHTRRPDPTP